MKIKLTAQELCVTCILVWPGPFPLFKGVQGIMPEGAILPESVKKTLKWKNNLGLKKMQKKQLEEFASKGIDTEAINAMLIIYSYEKRMSVLCNDEYKISFFSVHDEGIAGPYIVPEGCAALVFLNNGEDYEIHSFPDETSMNDYIREAAAYLSNEMQGKVLLKVTSNYKEGSKIRPETTFTYIEEKDIQNGRLGQIMIDSFKYDNFIDKVNNY